MEASPCWDFHNKVQCISKVPDFVLSGHPKFLLNSSQCIRTAFNKPVGILPVMAFILFIYIKKEKASNKVWKKKERGKKEKKGPVSPFLIFSEGLVLSLPSHSFLSACHSPRCATTNTSRTDVVLKHCPCPTKHPQTKAAATVRLWESRGSRNIMPVSIGESHLPCSSTCQAPFSSFRLCNPWFVS